jgi:hypothetical protein
LRVFLNVHVSADTDFVHAQIYELLLNTGPLPDGAIHPEDVATLRAVGERIRAGGIRC